MRVSLVAIAAVGLTGVLSPLRAAQDTLTASDAVALIRDVGTVEANGFGMKGREFGDLGEVSGSPEWNDKMIKRRPDNLPFKIVDASSATVEDYTLRVSRSVDKRHFEASLTPVGKGCGKAWFVDDRNVIFVGSPIGCK